MRYWDYDVAVIGAGVVGAAAARELSRYDLSICVLEKEEDVCSGTSKANSGIVHSGYDARPGSLKARFNVEGNGRMEQLSRDLDFDFVRNGSLVLCFDEKDTGNLKELLERGKANGVPGLRFLSGDEARGIEPNLTDKVVAALYAPTGGIVCPFGLTIALAENAYENGAEFRFLTEVSEIQKEEGGYVLKTGKGDIKSRFVVNAAGVYADKFHNMVSGRKLHITPRKGDYCLLDKEAGTHVSHTVFQLPGAYGKGVLVSPTAHGNLLIGPTAVNVEDRTDTATTAGELEEILEKTRLSVKDIPYRQVITSFSGLRASESGGDFIVGEAEDAEGFFDAAGIESPGLTSAPAIGSYLADLIAARAQAGEKENFISTRRGIPRPASMDREDWIRLIRERPDYGTIVCRCENVSEGEIVDSINRPLGAVSLDGIKRRVRQGMGRCQAGFCTPRTMEILSRELGIPMEEICKNAPGSRMMTGNRLGE